MPAPTPTSAGSRPVIFLSAGEPSGDLHGAALLRSLRQRFPKARFLGLGGEKMAAEGMELLADPRDLAVMGIAEVLKHLPFFIRLRKKVFETLEFQRVELVIPIDYPGFNLRLARHAHQSRIPVLYYIAPQVWAWHRSRAKQLASDTDRVAVILPFEEAFLRSAGAPAEFVGHPLVDLPSLVETRTEWMNRRGLDPKRQLLALFPGSRAQEISRHLELFEAAAARVVASRPEVQPVIATAPGLDPTLFSATSLRREEDARALLHYADAALVKSGTTTLEAALAGVPFAVVYRMSPVSFQLAKRLVSVPHIALANLVAEERLAPEFVQDEASPEVLSRTLLDLLDPHSPRRARMLEGFQRIRRRLGSGGAADRVADIAVELLQRAPER